MPIICHMYANQLENPNEVDGFSEKYKGSGSVMVQYENRATEPL